MCCIYQPSPMSMTYDLQNIQQRSETAVSEIDQNCTQLNILKKMDCPFVDLCHVFGGQSNLTIKSVWRCFPNSLMQANLTQPIATSV